MGVATRSQHHPSSSTGTTIPAQSGAVTSTVDYYDFGAPFPAAPPAGRIDNITGRAVSAATGPTTAG
jgi:hypothetical protein